MAYSRRRTTRAASRRRSPPARRRAPARSPARRAPALRRTARAAPREIRIVIQQPEGTLPAAPVGENLTVEKRQKKARL